MKIRHGAIVDNVATYVYVRFGDDRLWNEKALADRKSDNNTNTKNKNNVGGAWGPVPGSKTGSIKVHIVAVCVCLSERSRRLRGQYQLRAVCWVAI